MGLVYSTLPHLISLQVATDQEDIELGSSSTSISEPTSEEQFTTALSFYNLQQTHIIYEEDPDTKVLA